MPMMSGDVTYLVWSAALCIVMWVPYILARVGAWGLVDAVGYPENPPAVPKWAARAQKAHTNMVENLAPFAALVLAAQTLGASNEMTALGAALFFWARLVHFLVYLAGVPWARTLAFVVAWVGMVIIFLQIIA